MRPRFLCLAIGIGLAIILFILPGFTPVGAQTQAGAFWRYDAPGKLNIIEVEDVDGDGIDEILVVSDDINVMLLGGDGRPLWSTPYRAAEPISVVVVANVLDLESRDKQIALSTGNQLILLNNSGNELWRRELAFEPVEMVSQLIQDSGIFELIVTSESADIQRFNGSGQLTWEYDFTDPPAKFASPKIIAADINRDGFSELIFSYTTELGYSQLALLNPDGERIWEKPTSGSVTSIATIEFQSELPLDIAVATSLDRVYLYNADGQLIWPFRSPNKTITNLAAAGLEQGNALIIGTSVGTVSAYDPIGKRYWSRPHSPKADRSIAAISIPNKTNQDDRIAMAIVLSSNSDNTLPSELILLDTDGRTLEPTFPTSDDSGLSRLVDINNDGRSELLLAGFATLELLDPGIGVRKYSQAWDYRLDAEPKSVLAADINDDGEQELLVGTDDGRLHALREDGSPLWVAEIGGTVTSIEIARGVNDASTRIAVAHNAFSPEPDPDEIYQGRITIIRPDGSVLWNAQFLSTVSSLTTGDINQNGRPEVIAGTTDGLVTAFSLDGDEFWQTAVNAAVNQLLLIDGARGTEVILGSGANTVDRLNNKGAGPIRISTYLDEITYLDQGSLIQEDQQVLLVGLEDGSMRALDPRGSQIWKKSLDGIPRIVTSAGNSLLIGTDEQELIRLDNSGNILWRLPELGRITTVYWGDLDGDIQPDVAVGNREGLIQLITGDGSYSWDVLNVGSEVFNISGLRGSIQKSTDLVTITDNGVVTLYRSQANHRPLILNPEIEVGPGLYGISVSVIDVDADPVAITLEIFDPENGRWISQGEKTSEGASETIFWQVDPIPNSTSVSYRFSYDDGLNNGRLEPTPGPPPIRSSALNATVVAIIVLVAGSTAGAALFVWQTRTNTTRVRRYYQKIEQFPATTLQLLDLEYEKTNGSPDFLINLAGTARQRNNHVLASLADGLYLLDARPDSALPVITSALDEAEDLEPRWWILSQWLITFQIGQSLLQAPSITELALLRAQFEEALDNLKKVSRQVNGYNALRLVLTSLRDAERVDLTQDRLVYLNECIFLLEQFHTNYPDWPSRVDNTLAKGIANRWLGLIRAEIEDLRGRAKLAISLITKHVIPDERTIIALEIRNIGQAPARDLAIELEPNPAYNIINPLVTVPLLSPSNGRQVQFAIKPLDTDPFRIVFSINYMDQGQANRTQAFADRVHLLSPDKDFIPIVNPYSPGMPLRQNSAVFFGREELFDFVHENVGRLSQRNVLIFVGQRRTGKTSALLRLEHYLPDKMIPVYVDCQSLGVTPGMAALLHDISWSISDVLSSMNISASVGDLSLWNEDPAGIFQRQFLPNVRKELPKDTNIVLIFDEFEALQDLVDDGILPATLFTFLRHLMQHEPGLSFIFAGTHKLEEMGSDYWSVLFNIALYRHVGYLSSDAAKHLIREPVAPAVIYDDLAVEKILQVTAGHPYFLQLVCYTLVNRANAQKKTYITISDVNSSVEEMLRLGEVHFAYLWQRSSFVERALLAAASHLDSNERPFLPVELVQYLQTYRIQLEPAEVTKGLNNLVEREIFLEVRERGKTFYDMRIGLVGIWVSLNKSLSRLHDYSAEKLRPERESLIRTRK
ncbi:MAG: hypothetical protein BMS9Abin02_0258 [Anaerolineae bacterium]|nr:MAG: hypothetical protein BMS9Abin02_0258 [Anaerolineae bacterium]